MPKRNLSVESRHTLAENMKERIYSTITLLAVLATLWQNALHHSHFGAVASIIGAAVAIWLATLIANRISYRAVHGKPISHREYVKAFFTSSGLLAPAIPPTIIIAVSAFSELYSLKTALLVSMLISLLSMFALSFVAGWKIYNNIWRLLLVSSLELLVGAGIIVLKLTLGE